MYCTLNKLYSILNNDVHSMDLGSSHSDVCVFPGPCHPSPMSVALVRWCSAIGLCSARPSFVGPPSMSEFLRLRVGAARISGGARRMVGGGWRGPGGAPWIDTYCVEFILF